MNYWQPQIDSTRAGVIYCAEPLVASLLALFLPAWISRMAHIDYPNEIATVSLLVGGGLITAANVLIQSGTPAATPLEAAPMSRKSGG
jgi:hypothetical protein